jgi:ribosome recycling factor
MENESRKGLIKHLLKEVEHLKARVTKLERELKKEDWIKVGLAIKVEDKS